MNVIKNRTILHESVSLLYQEGHINKGEKERLHERGIVDHIPSDGSTRIFFRISLEKKSYCVGVLPGENSLRAKAEASSAYFLGKHLFSKQIPVPEILGWDRKKSLILYEDCGEQRLHDTVLQYRSGRGGKERLLSLYGRIVSSLCRMQVYGAHGFDNRWCFDTSYYDKEVMIAREAHYFLNSFLCNMLGYSQTIHGLQEEFEDIAKYAGQGIGTANYFLHRDFQSRNIMMDNNEFMFIDYQAGRLGPLGYDLASLLIDPYCRLENEIQDILKERYLGELEKLIPVSKEQFLKQFEFLFVQRNMQIIGAFSNLYKIKRKLFFKEYIHPSVVQLQQTLTAKNFLQYTVLRKTVERAVKEMKDYV